VLGPLPPLYRAVVALCALALFGALGAWLSFRVAGPLFASTGAQLGAAVGALVALLLLHDFSQRRLRPQHARHRIQR
jgi:uncharacterized membrane protein YccC